MGTNPDGASIDADNRDWRRLLVRYSRHLKEAVIPRSHHVVARFPDYLHRRARQRLLQAECVRETAMGNLCYQNYPMDFPEL
jgi:hypothetical protein